MKTSTTVWSLWEKGWSLTSFLEYRLWIIMTFCSGIPLLAGFCYTSLNIFAIFWNWIPFFNHASTEAQFENENMYWLEEIYLTLAEALEAICETFIGSAALKSLDIKCHKTKLSRRQSKIPDGAVYILNRPDSSLDRNASFSASIIRYAKI